MLGTVETWLDTAEIPAVIDGELLRRGYRCVDRMQAWLGEVTAAFDAHGGYETDGAVSCQAWLRHHTHGHAATASRIVRHGRRLRQLPVTAAALRAGVLSQAQVAAILVKLTNHLTDRYADVEAHYVALFAELSVDDIANVMTGWRHAATDTADPAAEPEPEEPARRLVLARLLDGRVDIAGHIDDTEGAEIIANALRLADTGDLDTPAAVRRGDALVDICRFFNDHHDRTPKRRHRPHINLLFDTTTGHASTIDGRPVAPTDLTTLLCDSVLRRVLTAGSVILDYGTDTYAVPPGLWQATALRDRGCRFPGCDRPISWCDAHHATPYPHGPTAINNLVMLCSRHHHLLHKPHWHAKLLPDATLEITNPTGTTTRSHPPSTHPRE